MTEVLTALGAVFAAAPQLQQAGAKNGAEVTKEIALSVVRHARMGRAVEDSVEQLDFKSGMVQMEQLGQMVQQIGQAVQKGAEQVTQMGDQLGKHNEIIGKIVEALKALPRPPQPQAQPMAA
jgi:methyl-accepting chemotaxis protein